jgi:ATP-dependent Lhr-like helicase
LPAADQQRAKHALLRYPPSQPEAPAVVP